MIGRRTPRRGLAIVCLLGACALGACSGLPPVGERNPSSAILDTADTRLGTAVAADVAANPGKSGFFPIGAGADAFLARIALARAAQRTLDVQYYIFHVDDTGVGLLGEILAAADRGVRVRLLLDDIHVAGRDDALAALDSHPNIEVRLFNPFAHRGARWVDLVTDFGRVNRRMHNKSITADGQLTIVGGRNIGNEYFAAGPGVEFGDFDVLAAGPVVVEVAKTFDEYWNSDVVYPIASLLGGGAAADAAKLGPIQGKVKEHMQALAGTPYAHELADSDLARSLRERRLAAHWGRATVIADRPEKVRLPASDASTHALPRLAKLLEGAQKELILVSPYFVPGDEGVAWLRGVASRGVRIRILTNSFVATDVQAVHAGYSAYRKDLLKAGIELYELKSTAEAELARAGKGRSLAGSSKSSLHAKTYMVDGQTLFVGSLNLDPRSARLNTEMGIAIESAGLCAYVRNNLLQRLPDAAYRVALDQGSERMSWTTRVEGRETRYEDEPGMGFFQALLQGLLRLLPIEEQL